jgi:hypothetical protein
MADVVNGAGAGVDEEVSSELFGYAASGWGGGLVGMVGEDEGAYLECPIEG